VSLAPGEGPKALVV